MTYPQVSHTGDESAGVPSSPSFPQIEEAVLAYWADDDTFRASVEQRDAGEDGANEFVFYDGPPFANGLPHYGHLLTGYVKDLVPRFQTMRGRRVERRFGWDTHGLPGRARGDAPARDEDDRGDPRPRHREVQRGVPQVRLRVHLGVARLRHPPGALGRLRQRLQDPRPPLHGERHVGLQAAPRQGARLRGLPRAALLLERRDAAVQPRAADGRGRLPAARRPRRDRRPAADQRTGRGCARTGLDDDAVDAVRPTWR